MSVNLGLVLDISLLVLLGATVFYAARLSFFMNNFRQGRSDMHRLIQDLSKQILQADKAVQNMRNMAEKSGKELQDIIRESQFLSDELRFMNESGDNLATRLEKLAERNRELVQLLESSGGIGTGGHFRDAEEEAPPPPPKKHVFAKAPEKPAPPKPERAFGFSIHDRDFDDEDDAPDNTLTDDLVFADDDFQSQSEREFYAALKRSRKGKER